MLLADVNDGWAFNVFRLVYFYEVGIVVHEHNVLFMIKFKQIRAHLLPRPVWDVMPYHGLFAVSSPECIAHWALGN